ncbi:hypothetical protein DXG03_001312 [Asterophora parasitica]|uniref:Metaxin glutathione S-transferase domain-containing protein n=1 Tax=Asterophora parasitica TaxID=117018 RepID=A0A9P7KAD2_9AGAR|nr:hypothetical protein DXG03_001312 [Asterophora parasitica]
MLATRPAVPVPRTPFTAPTLWILPPHAADGPLSADVECLKWQAYLALRQISNIHLRTDIHPDGALDARLPNLHAGPGSLLAAHHIPQWADQQRPAPADPLEGYPDEPARDESRAWVALLEGTVHAALLAAAPQPSYISSLLGLNAPPTPPLHAILTPPPPPLTGLASLFPPYGARISTENVFAAYRDAIASLSDRLGTDKWFLASSGPTPLDALAFAYLHCIVVSQNSVLRAEVTRRVNLVAWEWRVRELVRAAFVVPN